MNLFNEEYIHFKYNSEMDKKIINLTIFETLVFIVAFVFEYLALSQYLKNKELI